MSKEFVDGVLDEIVSSGFVKLVVFDEWNPHGACLSADDCSREKFLYLERVGT